MTSDGHVRTVADRMTGRLLDRRYLIGPRVARGGMASVYEATDTRLDRTVAVKVMHSGLGDDDEFAARFVREARAAARLSHPNVVAVYDQGDDEGTVFLAMELVSGHTLRDTISKESPMTPARALALIEPVLSALAAAHRSGLIHRDVKPENVLIADDGRVKVADFGLAKAISSDTQHTATGGVLIGTVSYIAPELVVNGRADARADIYAAGVVLYELLTGRKPHEGESPIAVAYKHVHEDVPPPSRLVPELPAYVDALVARATARDRDLRPADASVLLHHVHRVSHALATGVREDAELTADLTPTRVRPDTTELDGLDVPDPTRPIQLPSPPPSWTPEPTRVTQRNEVPGSRQARSTKRRRGPILLVLALLLVTAVGAGAYWYGWARYTSTPGVIGLDQAAAVERIEDAGLEAEVGDPAYSETVPKGEVIATDPEAGSRILDGDTVQLVLSLGKERYDVPKLRGLTEDAAQDALRELSLVLDKTTERFSETVPQGQIIKSLPKAGTTVKAGASVDLVVSKGQRPLNVGDWVGEPLDRMRQVLEGRGLVVDVTTESFSDTVPAGSVISHEPPGGTLFTGEAVSVEVSKGPDLIQVPGVFGYGVQEAIEALEAAGFRVDIEEADVSAGVGFVYSQSPSGGELAAKGSTVTLYLF